MPRIEKFPVSVEHEGNIYTGEQIVEGTKFRYQKVVFEGRTKHDSYRYLPDQTDYMNGIAKHLLIEIVRDRDNGL
jgi:hypothetical protein